MRYPPKRDRLYTVGPEPKGRLAGREHIADVAVGVWEEDEGVDRRVASLKSEYGRV
jgi:hypothetical protein